MSMPRTIEIVPDVPGPDPVSGHARWVIMPL
jgi:hypothetical protein